MLVVLYREGARARGRSDRRRGGGEESRGWVDVGGVAGRAAWPEVAGASVAPGGAEVPGPLPRRAEQAAEHAPARRLNIEGPHTPASGATGCWGRGVLIRARGSRLRWLGGVFEG